MGSTLDTSRYYTVEMSEIHVEYVPLGILTMLNQLYRVRAQMLLLGEGLGKGFDAKSCRPEEGWC